VRVLGGESYAKENSVEKLKGKKVPTRGKAGDNWGRDNLTEKDKRSTAGLVRHDGKNFSETHNRETWRRRQGQASRTS